MISLFRKIRQRLLAENRVSRYLIYAVGEIVLVVMGMLIALQVPGQNDSLRMVVSRISTTPFLLRLHF